MSSPLLKSKPLGDIPLRILENPIRKAVTELHPSFPASPVLTEDPSIQGYAKLSSKCTSSSQPGYRETAFSQKAAVLSKENIITFILF